ncbi:MAG: cobaltochelatase subunit CobN, partial [Methylococcales bacterium]
MHDLSTPSIGLLTHAPNDLMVLQSASRQLPEGFPKLKGVNLQALVDGTSIFDTLKNELDSLPVIILRVLGRLDSISGFPQLLHHVREHNGNLIVVSGTGEPDPELTAVSTVSLQVLHQVLSYFQAGGSVNLANMLRYLSDHLLLTGFGFEAAEDLPDHGLYHPDLAQGANSDDWLTLGKPKHPSVGIIFYRSHWMSGNTRFVDALINALEQRCMKVLPVFTSSLRIGSNRQSLLPSALSYFCRNQNPANVIIDVLINTTSFAMGEITAGETTLTGWSVGVLEQLNVPILQAITSGMLQQQWQQSTRGLNPLDAAMNVILPEFDGRIITVPVSFKAKSGSTNALVEYEPLHDRITRVAGLAARFATLKHKPNAQKRVAFIFTNSNSKASQIGNAVGLDAPASLMNILRAMHNEGYRIESLPENGTTLIQQLIDRCSYDEIYLTSEQLSQAVGQVSASQYSAWFEELPQQIQDKMVAQWGIPPGKAYLHNNQLTLAGIELGNALVVLQPPRGYGMDPDAIYHQPDLPPTHHYYALYRWLRDQWQADAIVHVGKHGTLEWLPGKGVGVSKTCFPDVLLADLPLFYPFIINDPGEGAQAKRRTHATVVDHLTPPMTSADTYGELAELTLLVDEYYQMEVLDPGKLPLMQEQIWGLVKKTNLDKDLQFKLLHHDHNHDDGQTHHHPHEHDHPRDEKLPIELSSMGGAEVAHLIEDLDGYLCELGAAQIRDGLHILGQAPASEQLDDMLVSLTRIPNQDIPSLPEEIAKIFSLDLDTLLENKGNRLATASTLQKQAGRPLVTLADALETIDALCLKLYSRLRVNKYNTSTIDEVIAQVIDQHHSTKNIHLILQFACDHLVPNLRRASDEIDNLLKGLSGSYIPAGPSGSPTRGMANILPTGRNFYSVDPRGVPSQSAWRVGQQLAHEVLTRHQRETGEYPECVAISIWGTSAMRTHGDDVAQILALLGVKPVWRPENRQVCDIEILPLDQL